MAEYHPEMEIETPVVHPFKSAEERFYPSWWDRLLGRDRYMNKLNHRNAYIQHLEYVNITEIEVLRQGLIDLQPEKVLEQEGKHLDEIGVLKARVGGLESEVRTITRQNRELESELAARKRQSLESQQRAQNTRVPMPEPTLIRPDRAQSLGRGHVAPNSGAHATSGQIGSTPQDGGSGLLMQAAVLHTVLASDSEPTRSEAACSGYRDAYEAPARSEPAYCAPEPTRSEPSYTPTPDSPSSSDGGGGGCD